MPTKVIPLIIKTQMVATSFNSTTGLFTTEPGNTTFDPTAADDVCLSKPNDVPLTLMKESPIVKPAHFVFGGTDVGKTPYNDAFQRGNFWNALNQEGRENFHTLLDFEFLDPIILEVPTVYGLALTDGNILGPPPFCAPMGIVDINWFDTHMTGSLLPSLHNVDPDDFSIFLCTT